MVIEPEVAALAATRRTQADLDALVQAAEAFRTWPKDDPHAVDVVAEFFEVMGAASRNQVLVLAKQSLTARAGPVTGTHDRYGAAGAPANRGCAAADHRRRAGQECGRSAPVDVEARARLSSAATRSPASRRTHRSRFEIAGRAAFCDLAARSALSNSIASASLRRRRCTATRCRACRRGASAHAAVS